MVAHTTPIHLSSSERTDPGTQESHNEDAVLRLPEQGLFCVADGMGGVAYGDEASRIVVATLAAKRTAPGKTEDIENMVQIATRALNEASYRIRDLADERGVSTIGSTAVVLMIDPAGSGRAAVLHAGDSRAYRLRGTKLDLLTVDHSIASAVGVSDDEHLPPMLRGVITNAVGIKETVELDRADVDVRQGDVLLLCSDGLTRELPDKAIRDVLLRMRAGSLDELARRLIDDANAAGGRDNISVILVRIDVGPTGPADDPANEEPPTDMTSHAAWDDARTPSTDTVSGGGNGNG